MFNKYSIMRRSGSCLYKHTVSTVKKNIKLPEDHEVNKK